MHAQNQWELSKDKKGIKVYLKQSDSLKIKEYRAEMSIKASVEDVQAAILNVKNLPKWNYKTEKAVLIKKINTNELLVHMYLDFPWPLKNRDNVSHISVITSAGGSVEIKIEAYNGDEVPVQKDYVRMHNFSGYWLLTPNGKYVDIVQQMYGDLEGDLPSWIINAQITKAPYNTFLNLRELLKKDRLYLQKKINNE